MSPSPNPSKPRSAIPLRQSEAFLLSIMFKPGVHPQTMKTCGSSHRTHPALPICI